jgi:putative molybdopterin biosynthesis protein
MLALREVLRSEAWQARLAQLAGYQPLRSGEVLSLKQQLPWWRYPRAKKRRAA